MSGCVCVVTFNVRLRVCVHDNFHDVRLRLRLDNLHFHEALLVGFCVGLGVFRYFGGRHP